jgi:hypothetical protein
MAFLFSRKSRQRRPASQRSSFVPRLEPLEDRTVLSTLTALNNPDRGTGSLRDAIAGPSSTTRPWEAVATPAAAVLSWSVWATAARSSTVASAAFTPP